MFYKTMNVAWLHWDPHPDAFYIPFTHLPVTYYGMLFSLGFIVGYFLMIRLLTRKLAQFQSSGSGHDLTLSSARTLSTELTDSLTTFIVIGTLIGARLGHVFFYDWPRYQSHPIDIFKVWEGGLASHGAAAGILIAFLFFYQYAKKRVPQLSYIGWLDMFVIPVAFAGFCIRLGNFMNQEILGPPTNLPWAVLFAHPRDGSAAIPRHPVQLYEALAYLGTFFVLLYLWERYGNKLKKGTCLGLFLLLVFGSRFLLEFLKNPSSMLIDESFLSMGQYLSLPLIFWGIWLLFRKNPEPA